MTFFKEMRRGRGILIHRDGGVRRKIFSLRRGNQTRKGRAVVKGPSSERKEKEGVFFLHCRDMRKFQRVLRKETCLDETRLKERVASAEKRHSVKSIFLHEIPPTTQKKNKRRVQATNASASCA